MLIMNEKSGCLTKYLLSFGYMSTGDEKVMLKFFIQSKVNK